MKRSKNFITLFLAICTLFIIQIAAAQPEADKSPGIQTQVDKTPAAPAQKDEKAATTTEQSRTSEKPAVNQADRVTQIIGKAVISQKGEDLGKIEDIVLSKDGCLDYMILAPGGFLGTGDRLIPIPWKSVKTGAQADTIIVDMDKSQLEKAPNFESKKWPNLSGSEWYGKIREFFGGHK